MFDNSDDIEEIEAEVSLPLDTIRIRPNVVNIGGVNATVIGSSSITCTCQFSSDVEFYCGIICSESSSETNISSVEKCSGTLTKTFGNLLPNTDYYLRGAALAELGERNVGLAVKVRTLPSQIPDEYQLVEWLLPSNDGIGFLETGNFRSDRLVLSYNAKLNADGSGGVMFGYYKTGFSMFRHFVYASSIYFDIIGDSSRINTQTGLIADKFCDYVIKNRDIICDGTLLASNIPVEEYTESQYLYAFNEMHYYSYAKWEVVGDNGLLTTEYEYYPVYRKSDNVTGFYDIKKRVFHPVSGTVGEDKDSL